ncbi:hypothetical protein OSB04_025350 [Centaurea solstitialis]|uniref:Retroviral polymerase SH3-like domain-containing protein n=1 Tax=Centaurea solstitialis TaxID=347529 RepID=A0AA38SVH9_9ASTR|nr:hypothetical protein OSB04_025350 [Centaurea solstitialis]
MEKPKKVCRREGNGEADEAEGEPLLDYTPVTYTFNGLQGRYKDVATFFRHSKPFPSFKEVRSMLQQEESQHADTVVTPPSLADTALVAASKPPSGSGPRSSNVPLCRNFGRGVCRLGHNQSSNPHLGVWIYALCAKSEVFEKFQLFNTYVKTQFNCAIKSFQCYHGGEFDNSKMHDLFTSHGIQMRFSCPKTSQQNGKFRRMIRTINIIICTILFHAHLPPIYWVDALNMATHLLNLLPSTFINNETHLTKLFYQKPSYTHLRSFGCLCYPRLFLDHKLLPRSTPCVFLGYPANHRGFRCLDLNTNRIIISRYKARVVANGRSQQQGVDCDETFSPVAKYATKLLEHANMLCSHPCRTPIDTASKLSGLHLFVSLVDKLIAYSDADFVSSWTLGSYLLSWSSKGQNVISRLSVEAEYQGVANVVAETTWVRNLLRELHVPFHTATIVRYANIRLVYPSTNPVQHQRTKHVMLDKPFVCNKVFGKVRVLYVPSRYQYTDIFTKCLPTTLLLEFQSSLSMRTLPDQTMEV